MPHSPHFILPTPCTFMTPHLPRSGLPLPGVRELFPDLFRPRSTAGPQTLPPSAAHDPQQCTPYDVTNPPSASAPHHFQPSPAPSNWPTARSTAVGTTDHRYTRARFNPPTSPYSHVRPNTHTTRWRSDHDVVGRKSTSRMSPPRSASPEVSSPDSQSRHQVDHGIGPSSLPDKEQTGSPMTSSPHAAFHSTEFTQQSTFEQKSVEPHSSKKRHKCDVCGSYWGRPSSLKIHMVSHTGVKEFVCSVCKQDFGVKSNYTRHIRVHHKNLSEGSQTRAAGRRRGSRRNQDAGPVRFVDEGPKFQGQ
jgi:hypothetical protein